MIRSGDIHVFPVGYTISLYNRRLHQILHGLVKNSGNKNGVITGTAERGVQRFSLYKRSAITMQRYENFCIYKCFSKEKLTQFFKFSRDVTRRFHFAFSRRPKKQHIWRVFFSYKEKKLPWNTRFLRVPWQFFVWARSDNTGAIPMHSPRKKTKHKGVSCRNTTKFITLPSGRIIRQRDNTFGRRRPKQG